MTSSFCPRCIPPGVWALCAVCFLAALWGGSNLYHKPPVEKDTPKPPGDGIHLPPDVTVRFIPYDTQGNLLNGVTMEANTSPSPSAPKYPIARMTIVPGTEVSEPEGTSVTMEFRYHGQQMSDTVLWRGGDSFRTWLKEPLRKTLQARDKDYNHDKWDAIVSKLQGQISGTKIHYPVVFKAAPEHR